MPHYPRLNARFPRKRAFITGAGSGLGLALAQALAREGWTLGLFDRDLERLTKVEGDLSAAGVPVLAYPGDVTQADELTVAVNSFSASHDGLDVMINNAGVAAAGPMMDTAVEDWRWIFDINLIGVVHGCRASIPHLQRNGSGLLINVASAAAFAAAPGMAAYNATKAAVLSLSETLMNELHTAHTQVSVVMPGFFQTNLLSTARGNAHSRAHAQRLMSEGGGQADDLANYVLQCAGAGRAYIVWPASARAWWRIKRWAPLSVQRLFARRIATLYDRRVHASDEGLSTAGSIESMKRV